jgi:CheY-like chemotaxis protein
MRRVLLIHLNSAEGTERANILRDAGYDVTVIVPQGLKFLRDVRRALPDAIVVDIERLPSVGRDIGIALRMAKSTRNLPMVFAGGVAEKIAGIRMSLPDASYAPWPKIGTELKRAMAAQRTTDPVVPRSIFEPYSGTPLLKKLGIKPNSSIALLDAPDGFSKSLGPLPEGAKLLDKPSRNCDLTMWFVRSSRELNRRIKKIAANLDDGLIWIAWPKKTSAIVSDLSQASVRGTGLATGLVDFKVCAIDATWSGLLFKRRKQGTEGAASRRDRSEAS